jgi:pyruvate kinase
MTLPHYFTVLLDTKGPEIRTGFFANDAKKIDLKKGQTLILTADYHFKGDSTKLACSYPQLATSVKPGQQILVADGSLVLTVLTTDPAATQVTCRVENNSSIGERKNMNLPGCKVDLPTFTEQDKKDIVDFGIARRVEFIAASFVRKAEDVMNLKKLLRDNGGEAIKIISKIENQEGLENYDEILKVTDAIMVARGDVSCCYSVLYRCGYDVYCSIPFTVWNERTSDSSNLFSSRSSEWKYPLVRSFWLRN